MFPEPLTPIAITAGIISNLAYDILRQNSNRLEKTLIGRALKATGLIEPDFDNRLRLILEKAIAQFFEEKPSYALTGILAFLSDPRITEQLRGNILDAQPVNGDIIEIVLNDHLKHKDRVTYALIKQKNVDLESLIPLFLFYYRRSLNQTLKPEHIAIVLNIYDVSKQILEEITKSEGHLKNFILTQSQNDLATLQQIAADQRLIKEYLGIDRSDKDIYNSLNLTITSRQTQNASVFARGGLCQNYVTRPLPNRYFVAQELDADDNDLRNSLSQALNEFGYTPIRTDDHIQQGHILCKVSAIIEGTPFGIYQLSVAQNRNVYLELGIALGLNRPFVLVKHLDAIPSPFIEGIEYYQINSYLEMRYELAEQLRTFILNIAHPQSTHSYETAIKETVIISHGSIEEIDFTIPIAKIVSDKGLLPIILGKSTGKLQEFLDYEKVPYQIIGNTGQKNIDSILEVIHTAKFGIFRVDKECSSDNFLCLGISIGLGRPGLLIHKTGQPVPSMLKGLATKDFSSYSNLKHGMEELIDTFAKKYS